MNETVREHCTHKDCMYRTTFGSEPCCGYMLITDKPRGCDISRCDKYEAGSVPLVSALGGLYYQVNSSSSDE